MSEKGLNCELISKRIKFCREKLEINRVSLARLAELPPSFITRIEKGERIPSIHSLKKIALVLKVSLDYLIGETEISKVEDMIHHNECHSLLNKFKDLSPSFQENVIEFVGYLSQKQKNDI